MKKYLLFYISFSTTNKTSKNILTVLHIIIHNGDNNGDTYVAAWDIVMKASKPPSRIWKYKIDILCILKKTNLQPEKKAQNTAQSHFTHVII